MSVKPGTKSPRGGSSSLRRQPQQARGRARVEAILDAAAREFDDVSFAAATTSAIAQRAGVPIGTVYQFFTNKDAILHALGARFVEETLGYFDTLVEGGVANLPLAELVDRVVDSMAQFHLERPGYRTLMSALESSREVASGAAQLHKVLADRCAQLVGLRAPHLSPSHRALVGVACVHVANLLQLLPKMGNARAERALVDETKAILIRYLEAYERDAPTSRSAGQTTRRAGARGRARPTS